jgi:hypothetical protein
VATQQEDNMSWLDELKNLPSDMGLNNVPGAGIVGKVLHDAGHIISGEDGGALHTMEKYANAPGQAALAPETLPGSAAPKTGIFSPYPNSFDVGKAVKGITGGGGSSKKKDPTPPPPPTGQTTPQPPAPDDVLTSGLGMFFSQYLAPMMQQINSQNNSMINQWGDTMNTLLQQPLPAGVKAIMQPWVAQNAQTLGMINSAAANQVAGQIPFNTLMNELGQQAQGQQAVAAAIPTAAANAAIGGTGSLQGLQNYLNSIGEGGLAQVFSGGLLQQLTQPQSTSKSSSSSSASASPAATTNTTPQPIIIQPSTTTAPATTANAGSASTALADTIAQSLYATQQQQNTAGYANQSAAAGYTP